MKTLRNRIAFRNAALGIICLLVAHMACGIEYLAPEARFTSPDEQWDVFVVRRETDDFDNVEFYISPRSTGDKILLAKNGRHFGAEWSPDSKVLLVYDNNGSGTSDVIVFQQAAKGWQKIGSTPSGFHIIWRLQEWHPDGVLLRAHSGGSEPAKVPPTVLIRYK